MLSLRHAGRRLPVLSRALSHQASRAVSATTSTSSHESTAFSPEWGWMGMAAIVSTLGAASAACKAQPEPAKEVEHDVVLDHEAKGVFSTPIAGIKSYSCASYKANLPIEDRFAVHADKHTVYAAIFDGHGGWQVAEYAQNHLIENAKAELAKESAQTVTKIESALEQAFLRTDFDLKEIVRGAFQLGFGQVNRVGACSMLAYVTDNLLVIANAGDERAVLGSFENDNLIAIPMSNDHNAKLPVEMARLAREHPGEDNIVVCKHPESCYVKGGLQPTRALGDFAFKDVDFNAPAAPTRRGGGRHIAPPYTPPYVLAKPEVQTHTVTGADKFLILGSDGVWDFLTNQEAVEIVHHYVSRGEAHLASRAVVELVLAKVAEVRGMDIEDLLEVAPGKPRRRLHDDTTVVVLVFS
ncbi:unnamed protein product [Aphanomyces euteiches]|uniref:PPM-type phosphatase domain-containing protein n=1 Tax=Aphanomyces euteiches TaxID=100861 RepID=A0A6G0XA89_9STRA|nr:hypothetical protein Ae201684_006845 [Aphanomyces euteiches]KAH9086842.1 hypothetical protein Ae201684P_000260 [Aphanomyces euteiches]KAH9141057.1 hypothetical protein AeRB84_014740 [Aphanomyces euteiches]